MKHYYQKIFLYALLTLLSLNAYSEDKYLGNNNYCIGGIHYKLDSNVKTAWVTYYYTDNGINKNDLYVGSITIPSSVEWKGTVYNVTLIEQSAFAECKKLTSVTIPESVKSIRDEAFMNCTGLTSITIHNGYIGNNAFKGCANLTTVTLGEGVTQLGSNVFVGTNIQRAYFANIESICKMSYDGAYSNPLSYAHNLYIDGELIKDLVIPEGITKISHHAFRSVTSLESITIPYTVTDIAVTAFRDCSNLRKVTINSNAYLSQGRDNSYRNIKETFEPHVSQYVIGEGVTTIGSYAFAQCANATSIIIPNSVTSIGGGAFSDCTSLRAITIPKELNNIGQLAFSNCMGIKIVKSYMKEPLAINGLQSFPNTDAVLCVPQGSKSLYENANYWNRFKRIEEMSSNYSISVPEYGIRTYSHYDGIDLTNVDGLSAYVATEYNSSTGELLLNRVYKVPAGEGVLLKGNAGEYTVSQADVTDSYSNLLHGLLTSESISPVEDEYTNLILANGNHGICFYTLAEEGEISWGKAYLHLPSSVFDIASSQVVRVVFDDEKETSAITVPLCNKYLDKQIVYDLQGRRVEKPIKGLYIVNGKKILIK